MVEDLASHEEQSGGGVVAEADVEGEEVSNNTTSALRDNIAKKKQHAYYYAHAHKANGPEVIVTIRIISIEHFLPSHNRSQLMLKTHLFFFIYCSHPYINSGMVRLSLNY
jgi:hypothetical protein